MLDDRGISEGRIDPTKVRRVLICSGRVAYDLMAERDRLGRNDVAVIRLERLYPLPHRTLSESLDRFGDAEIVWVQDEPANMGPWPFMNQHLPGRRGPHDVVGDPLAELVAVGRLAAPARGGAARAARPGVRVGPRCTTPTAGSRSSPRDADAEEVTLEWLAGQLVTFVDLHPEFETAVDRLASWLARDEDDE